MLSLDLAKAFDSLTFSEMYVSLRECNVPDSVAWLVVEVHKQTICEIRHRGIAGSTRMLRGLRQMGRLCDSTLRNIQPSGFSGCYSIMRTRMAGGVM